MNGPRLAVSNIAWSPEEDSAAHALLRSHGVDLLEIAPTRFWSELSGVPKGAGARLARHLAGEGLRVCAFQALLFGRPDLVVFGDEAVRASTLAYLGAVAELAGILGAGAMVFGSPKNRLVPAGLSEREVMARAASFFHAAGDVAARHGTCFCLEPNPAAYGGNFMLTMDEAAAVVRAADSPGIRLQVDGGELAMNQEDLERVLPEHSSLIGHVHLSQPMLESFAVPWEGHARTAAALRRAGYHGVVSIEMKRQPDGLASVDQAIRFARTLYPA